MMRNRRWARWIWLVFIVVVVGLLILQLVAARGMTNPPVLQEPPWDTPETRQLAVRACFDCHSNETRWPWYSKVPGVSLLLVDHVNEGREKLNFSEWVPGRKQSDEAAETVREGSMPPGYYTLMHPEARLSDAERQRLIAGLTASVGEGERGGREREEHERDDD